MTRIWIACVMLMLVVPSFSQKDGFHLNDRAYFENGGVDVMAFQDYYPEGHQGGVVIIMHGIRLATNGDLRLNATPGQWQPIPRQKNRTVDGENNVILTTLVYPDSSINGKGFNPVTYPDLYFNYTVNTRGDGDSIIITVDLDRPVPAQYAGNVGFNLELFPGALFGKSWYLGSHSGLFPRQANGPGMPGEDGAAAPMANREQAGDCP